MLTFYSSTGAEAAAVRRAAARAGCRIASLEVRQTVGGPSRLVGSLGCSDGWVAASLLLALAEEDAATEGARQLARALRVMARDDASFARAVHAFVRGRVHFTREEGEVFQSGAFTLQEGFGDCDDHFRLLYAIARAGGLEAKLAILHHGEMVPIEMRGPAHAAAVLCPGGVCHWAETTVAARYGEAPNDAARRLGLTNERSDIAREVVIMSASELPPLPPGFEGRNPPDLVARDVAALVKLGYLPAGFASTDAGDPVFRKAVLAFQMARGFVGSDLDGDVGPKTRAELAAASGLTMGAPSSAIFTHADARAALQRAYVAQFGHDPTKGELDFGLAVAHFETYYGRGGDAGWANRGQFGRWASQGKINWGALEAGSPDGSPKFVKLLKAAGLAFTLEHGSDGGNSTYFYLFPDDDQAARAFLIAWGQPDTLAAAASGSAQAVAASMRNHGYYTGFHVGPGKLTPALVAANKRIGRNAWQEEASDDIALQKNVAEYAQGLASSVRIVNGSGGVDAAPHSSGIVGGVIVLLGILGSIGAAAYAEGVFS